jgi:hypothetical protein
MSKKYKPGTWRRLLATKQVSVQSIEGKAAIPVEKIVPTSRRKRDEDYENMRDDREDRDNQDDADYQDDVDFSNDDDFEEAIEEFREAEELKRQIAEAVRAMKETEAKEYEQAVHEGQHAYSKAQVVPTGTNTASPHHIVASDMCAARLDSWFKGQELKGVQHPDAIWSSSGNGFRAGNFFVTSKHNVLHPHHKTYGTGHFLLEFVPGNEAFNSFKTASREWALPDQNRMFECARDGWTWSNGVYLDNNADLAILYLDDFGLSAKVDNGEASKGLKPGDHLHLIALRHTPEAKVVAVGKFKGYSTVPVRGLIVGGRTDSSTVQEMGKSNIDVQEGFSGCRIAGPGPLNDMTVGMIGAADMSVNGDGFFIPWHYIAGRLATLTHLVSTHAAKQKNLRVPANGKLIQAIQQLRSFAKLSPVEKKRNAQKSSSTTPSGGPGSDGFTSIPTRSKRRSTETTTPSSTVPSQLSAGLAVHGNPYDLLCTMEFPPLASPGRTQTVSSASHPPEQSTAEPTDGSDQE